jgi:hypothetical protein
MRLRDLPRPTAGDWIGGGALAVILAGLMFLPLVFGG